MTKKAKTTKPFKAENVLRTLAAFAGLATVLAEPIGQGIYRANGATGGGKITAFGSEFMTRLKNTSTGTWFQAFVPTITVEVGVQGKSLIGRVTRGVGRAFGA